MNHPSSSARPALGEWIATTLTSGALPVLSGGAWRRRGRNASHANEHGEPFEASSPTSSADSSRDSPTDHTGFGATSPSPQARWCVAEFLSAALNQQAMLGGTHRGEERGGRLKGCAKSGPALVSGCHLRHCIVSTLHALGPRAEQAGGVRERKWDERLAFPRVLLRPSPLVVARR